jgi:hypothetical protein
MKSMELKKYLRQIRKYLKRRKLLMALPSNRTELKNANLAQLVSVTSPIALISQIQRSGGSLLSQLFDFHPQLHAHPHELKIGYPKKYIWPDINLKQSPNRWFSILFEESVIRHLQEGYKKEPTSDTTFPFIFAPYVQKKIFYDFLKKLDLIQLRDIFNTYMTSYFGAWLNNKNYKGDKKYITGFTPRLSETKANMEKFFSIYPDGRLISIIRNPKNWFPSALRHNQKIKKDKYSDIYIALDQWKQNSEAVIRNKAQFEEKVCLIRFEDLIQKTEGVMKYLSQFLEIEYNQILLTPTFNGTPIGANTSFDDDKEGIISNTVERHKTLSSRENEIIEQETGDLYHKVLERVEHF